MEKVHRRPNDHTNTHSEAEWTIVMLHEGQRANMNLMIKFTKRRRNPMNKVGNRMLKNKSRYLLMTLPISSNNINDNNGKKMTSNKAEEKV